MAKQSFQVEAVGHIYAQALVNLAQQQNVLDAVTEDVHGIGELLKANASFRQFVQAVTISADEKTKALTNIFSGKVHQLTLETLKSMARRERLMFLQGFVDGFDSILAKLAGRVEVELTTAAALAEPSVERIKAAVKSAIGKEPHFTMKVDASLIGGIRLRIGDTLIDGSIDTQLDHMRESLQRGGMNRLQDQMDQVVAA